MTDWNALIDTAIIGTSASRVDTPAGMTPEAALLRRLALAGVQRRAGYIAQVAKPRQPAEPPPPETLPACSENEMSWLTVVNTAHLSALIPDWCLIIAGRGKRVPHRSLPYVLNVARSYRDSAPYIAQVIGERGRWLVMHSDGYEALKAALALPELPTTRPTPPPDMQVTIQRYLDEYREQMLQGLSQ